MTVRGYTLGIDWSRNGVYTGALEDASSYVDKSDITVTYGRERTSVAATLTSGSMGFVLHNRSRYFSPEYTSSPIYGKVLPGCAVRFDRLFNGTLYNLFSGVLDTFDVNPTAPGRDFTAEVLDAWGRPGAEKLSTPVYSGLRTGDAIGIILDKIGWAGARDLDPGATIMPWWWEEGTDAATAVQKVVDSEGPPAIAYVQGGTFVFRDRHHRLTRTASTTSNGTFTHILPAGTGPTGDFKILKDSFTYDHGLKSIANSCVFSVDQRQADDETEVWSTDTPITLAAGETQLIEVAASDPFVNAQTPVQDIDYDMAYGSITATLSRDSGQSVLLTITAGGVDAMVNRLAVRAVPITVARTVKVSDEDTSSIGTYGRQTWPGEIPWAGLYDAQAIAQRIVSIYASARPVVTFEIAAVNDAHLAQILARTISDRVTVRNDVLGINGPYIVEQVQHTVKQLGVMHKLRLTCEVPEPVQPANVFTFDVAGKGFNDGAFGIDGIDNASTLFRFDVAGQGFDQGRFGT